MTRRGVLGLDWPANGIGLLEFPELSLPASALANQRPDDETALGKRARKRRVERLAGGRLSEPRVGVDGTHRLAAWLDHITTLTRKAALLLTG